MAEILLWQLDEVPAAIALGNKNHLDAEVGSGHEVHLRGAAEIGSTRLSDPRARADLLACPAASSARESPRRHSFCLQSVSTSPEHGKSTLRTMNAPRNKSWAAGTSRRMEGSPGLVSNAPASGLCRRSFSEPDCGTEVLAASVLTNPVAEASRPG